MKREINKTQPFAYSNLELLAELADLLDNLTDNQIVQLSEIMSISNNTSEIKDNSIQQLNELSNISLNNNMTKDLLGNMLNNDALILQLISNTNLILNQIYLNSVEMRKTLNSLKAPTQPSYPSIQSKPVYESIKSSTSEKIEVIYPTTYSTKALYSQTRNGKSFPGVPGSWIIDNYRVIDRRGDDLKRYLPIDLYVKNNNTVLEKVLDYRVSYDNAIKTPTILATFQVRDLKTNSVVVYETNSDAFRIWDKAYL